MNPLVYVTTDESCLGNQHADRDRPGGAAGLMEHFRDGTWVRRDYWISEPSTTNNRMALRSAIEGLRHVKRPSRVILSSDSEYLVKGIREWLPMWIGRGWKRKTGGLKNEELWRDLAAALARHEVHPRWVRGHARDPRNEYADHLATRAARAQDASDGPVPSEFETWVERQREEHERYFDFIESAPPPEEDLSG